MVCASMWLLMGPATAVVPARADSAVQGAARPIPRRSVDPQIKRIEALLGQVHRKPEGQVQAPRISGDDLRLLAAAAVRGLPGSTATHQNHEAWSIGRSARGARPAGKKGLDILGGIYGNATYTQLSGASAVDYGLVGAAGFPGLHDIGKLALSPMYLGGPGGASLLRSWSSSGDLLGNALRGSDLSASSIYDPFTSLLGGSYNPFLGPVPYPGLWQSSFPGVDPFYYTTGLSSTLPPTLLATLGYSSNSPYSFGTQYLMGLNNWLYEPWTQPAPQSWGGWLAAPGEEVADASRSQGQSAAMQGLMAAGALQLDGYYQDQALSDLRVAASEELLGRLYRDPYYMALIEGLEQHFNNVYAQCPSYPEVLSLAADISSWIDIPDDPALLADRYHKRDLLEARMAQLDAEAAQVMLANPAFEDMIAHAVDALALRMEAAWDSDDTADWFKDWAASWDAAYASSDALAPARAELQTLAMTHPELERYQDDLAELTTVLDRFDGHPLVEEAEQATEAIATDPELHASVGAIYGQYRDAMTALVSNPAYSDFSLEAERLLEGTNLLSHVDADLHALGEAAQLQKDLFEEHRRSVTVAVADCLQRGGCDPETDPVVRSLLDDPDTAILFKVEAMMYDSKSHADYDFFTDDVYVEWERQAAGRIDEALDPIAPIVDLVREAYRRSVEDIPEVASLHEQYDELVCVLQDGCPDLVSEDVRARFADRTRESARRLRSLATTAPAIETPGAVDPTETPPGRTPPPGGITPRPGTPIASPTPTIRPQGELGNISTRGFVGTGDSILIGGFIIEDGPADVVVRAIGPDLSRRGVSGALADPVLRIFDGRGRIIAENDDWTRSDQRDRIAEHALKPAFQQEAMLLLSLPKGAYTAHVLGGGGGTGVALVEVFKEGGEGELGNISTRGTIAAGDNQMIGGFIIRHLPTEVVIRALGPSLEGRVLGFIVNPRFQLMGKALVGENDDWPQSPRAADLARHPLRPASEREAMMITTLDPGAYTAIVSGSGGVTGIGMVEVFKEDEAQPAAR